MKLPAALFPPLSASPTTRTASAPGVPVSMFGARQGTAFGEALGAALDGAGTSIVDGLPTNESERAGTANEPGQAADAAFSDPSGHLAHADSERAPAIDAAMNQFWAAAQVPATQLQPDAALAVTPQAPAADSSLEASDGVAPAVAADALAAVRAADPDARTSAGQPPAAAAGGHPGSAPAQSAVSTAVPGGAKADAATSMPMAAVAAKFSADTMPARFNNAIAAARLEEETPAAARDTGRQTVDAAVAPATSAPASAATSAVVPPAVPQLAQAPVPASMAPGSTQQAVPAGTPMLSEQLARPLFALAAAPLGEHVMTINVVPDALGPVTVRAHLATDGIRIEMMSPSDAGREGLRNILADLRRDLAAGGMAASLSMGSGNGNAGQDHGAGQRTPQAPANPWNPMARPGDQDQMVHRGMAPSEVPSPANNSLDITV